MPCGGRSVGEIYSDNYDDKLNSYLITYPGFFDYSDNLNESYFVSDIFMSYELSFMNLLTPWKVYLQVNNIFDNLYSANAVGKEFFPAAERKLAGWNTSWIINFQAELACLTARQVSASSNSFRKDFKIPK